MSAAAASVLLNGLPQVLRGAVVRRAGHPGAPTWSVPAQRPASLPPFPLLSCPAAGGGLYQEIIEKPAAGEEDPRYKVNLDRCDAAVTPLGFAMHRYTPACCCDQSE